MAVRLSLAKDSGGGGTRFFGNCDLTKSSNVETSMKFYLGLILCLFTEMKLLFVYLEVFPLLVKISEMSDSFHRFILVTSL